jgi:hypothetical protein
LWLEKQVLCLLAGPQAELRAEGKENATYRGNDYQEAKALVRMVRGRILAADVAVYVHDLAIRADELLAEQWEAVTRVAQALLRRGRLSGRAALQVYDIWRRAPSA